MSQQKGILPIFYHPTNVMSVDDDRDLLNTLSAGIDSSFPYVLKDSPLKALDYLRTHTYNLRDLSKLLSESHDTLPAGDSVETLGIHFPALRSGLDLPERFKKITVVLVDQMMPEMTGLEFCQKVRELNLPVKLLLLTGVAGNVDAVNAFNHGIINAFISKGESQLMKTINDKIKQLAWEQFQEIGNGLLGVLSHQSDVLQDAHFKALFEEIRLQHQVSEFYLLDTTCSYLLIDNDGKAKLLMVRSLSDFETTYEMAKDSDAPYAVLQSLRDKQNYPFTRLSNPYPVVDGDAWEEIMVPIDKVPGRDIFYALIDISQKDIFYFDKYMGEIWPQP